MIESYAKQFGLDPDQVWQKETDDIVIFLHLWKERAEYVERYRLIDKAINKAE